MNKYLEQVDLLRLSIFHESLALSDNKKVLNHIFLDANIKWLIRTNYWLHEGHFDLLLKNKYENLK